MQKKSDALGKGIRSLLQNIDADLKNNAGSLKTEVVEKVANQFSLPLDKIEVNPNQPRKDFEEVALSELASSIKMHGIIQPLTVVSMPNGNYRYDFDRVMEKILLATPEKTIKELTPIILGGYFSETVFKKQVEQ